MKRFFSKQQLSDIRAKFDTIERKADRLMVQYVSYPFNDSLAKEYAHQGFGRRLDILRRCIQNVFKLVPPHTARVPQRPKLYDAQINIQAFITNVYGGIDNLAWTWVHERGLADSIPRSQVGLRKRHGEVRSSLSVELQAHLATLDSWFEYVVEYRDALAHRIPLYIPPGGVRIKDADLYNALSLGMAEALNRQDGDEYWRLSDQQNGLLMFQPLITHSVNETTAHFAFHAQMIADLLTVEELGEKMLREFRRVTRSPGSVNPNGKASV